MKQKDKQPCTNCDIYNFNNVINVITVAITLLENYCTRQVHDSDIFLTPPQTLRNETQIRQGTRCILNKCDYK